jgi:hypothetical protein
VSSKSIITSLLYPLKYETFVALPLLSHSIVSKQHFQFKGSTVCKDTNTTRRRAKLYAISLSQLQRLITPSQGSKLPLYINYIWYRPVSLRSENYRTSITIPKVPIHMINTGVWRWMSMYCTPQHWMEGKWSNSFFATFFMEEAHLVPTRQQAGLKSVWIW